MRAFYGPILEHAGASVLAGIGLIFAALAPVPAPAASDMVGRIGAARTFDLHVSPGCPHCRTVLEGIRGQAGARPFTDGRIAVRVLPVYFTVSEVWADRLARCAGERYLDTIGEIMRGQPGWSQTYHRSRGTEFSLDNPGQLTVLKAIVVDAGLLSAAEVQTCLGDQAEMVRLLEAFNARNEALQIHSVPLLIAGDKRIEGTHVLKWMRDQLK